MKIALTQPVLNKTAKMPGGPAMLREQRKRAEALRDKAQREHEAHMAEVDGLIRRIGIALGEVQA